jgi:hypothetical protein
MSDGYEGDSTTVRRLNPPLQQEWADQPPPHTNVAITDDMRQARVVTEPTDLRASIIAEAAFHYTRAYEEARHGNNLLRVVDQAHGQELERLVRELREAAEAIGAKT